jgi:hypothetical protein
MTSSAGCLLPDTQTCSHAWLQCLTNLMPGAAEWTLLGLCPRPCLLWIQDPCGCVVHERICMISHCRVLILQDVLRASLHADPLLHRCSSTHVSLSEHQ